MRRDPNLRHLLMSSKGDDIQATKTKLGDDSCTDFVMGTDNDVTCTDTDNHTLVTAKDDCIEAASRSGATTNDDTLKMNSSDQAVSPTGCFKRACSSTDSSICYFYNGIAQLPANAVVTGTPVCSRKKILTGTAGVGGGCPTGYEVIEGAGSDVQNACISAAACLGKSLPQAPNSMLVGNMNASKHLDYPAGCFIDSLDGLVYFNGPHQMGSSTAVTGTSICTVSDVVSWNSASSGTTAAPSSD